MKFTRNVVICIAAFFALTACSDGSDDSSSQTSAPQQAVSAPYVVSAGGYGNESRLQCAEGLEATRLGLGTHTDPNVDYKLEENRDKDDNGADVQTSVTLTMKVPAGWSVPSAIVHAAESSDQEFEVNAGPEGTVKMDLLTKQYAYLPDHFDDYPITGVTLCISQVAASK